MLHTVNRPNDFLLPHLSFIFKRPLSDPVTDYAQYSFTNSILTYFTKLICSLLPAECNPHPKESTSDRKVKF